MTQLDRYLGKKLIATFIKILVSLVMLFVVIDLLTHRQDNIAKYDIPAGVVFKYYLTFIPTILFEYQFAPMAVLISALMVLGKASQDSEITAALAGGISLRQIVRVPVIIAIVVAVSAFIVDNSLGIHATKVAKQIEKEYFAKSSALDREGVSWANLKRMDRSEGDPGTWTCHILKFNRLALTGQDVYIHSITENKVEEIQANRIYWDEADREWVLEDGRYALMDAGNDNRRTISRITQETAPFSEPPEKLFALDEPPSAKSVLHLKQDLEYAESLGVPTDKYWVDYYAKFARPALAFVMIWLAIPFAIRLRRGGVMVGFGISLAVALAYLFVFYLSLGMGRFEMLPPMVAAWLANLIFLTLGLALTRKTVT